MGSSQPTLRLLVAESETPQAREERRGSVGRSSGETYLDILEKLAPGVACERIQPADADAALAPGATLAGYDAVFLTGSPRDAEPQAHRRQDGLGGPPRERQESPGRSAVYAGGRVHRPVPML